MTQGERIKYYRERKGLTQAELGKLCGVSYQTIQKYEKDIVTNLPLEKVKRLAIALGVSPGVIGGWSTEEDDAKANLIKSIDASLNELDQSKLEEALRYLNYLKSL